MTILDLVRIVRSNLKLLLISVLVGVLLAAAYTLTRPVQYEATSTAQVVAGNSQDPNSALLAQQLSTGRATYYSQLSGSAGVAQRIIKASNGSLSGGDFSIAGAVSEGSSTLALTATGTSAEKAQKAANLAPQALAAEAKYLETLGTTTKNTIYRVFPLTVAGKPTTPSSPKWPFNLAVGALLGAFAGIATIVLRKQLDSRVRHTSDLEKITGAGVLGVIPKAKDLQGKERGGLGSLGPTSEAFRMLRTNLRYVSAEHPPSSLVITSAVQSEGKSTVAANLTRVLAAAGQKVILVDTDLRRPVVHETFDVDNSIGLTEVLTGQAKLADAIQQGDHKNLFLITAGRIPPNPSELLGSRRMSAIIDALKDEYFVILDAPPLLPVTDGGLLAVAADGVAVVYQHGRTHREQVALCTKILDQVGAHYFGSILNMTPPKEMGSAIYGYGAGNYGASGYGYGYGYGYGELSDADISLAPTPASVHGITLEKSSEPTRRPATGSVDTTTSTAAHSTPVVQDSPSTTYGATSASEVQEEQATTQATSGLSSEWDTNTAPPSRRQKRLSRGE